MSLASLSSKPLPPNARELQIARVMDQALKQVDPVKEAAFILRLRKHLPRLRDELQTLYGHRADFESVIHQLIDVALESFRARSPALRALDLQRDENTEWLQSEHMLGGVCYVDRFGGTFKGVEAQIPYFKELGLTYLHLMPPYDCPEPHNDGGYAVSSYRRTKRSLGTIDDLRDLVTALREAGISTVLDFVFNHTSDEHDWARAAKAGDAVHQGYYFIFPDRTEPDRYEKTTREIFPDEHSGAFTQLDDGRWVWTTFHSYQWDLNYTNPAVFASMAREMFFIANLGVEFLRMDAVAFIWKRMGTGCENLPEAHALLRAYNALVRIATPALLFKSEAIVHPDDVVRYIDVNECQVSYNPLLMALQWNSLATRDVGLLQLALQKRHALPAGTAWVNYVRSHDDIGWTFADEDAAAMGLQGFDHRQFLNRFYVNRFPGSFARGVPFQDHPVTQDCRISGTCASLCGLEQNDAHAVDRVLLLHGVMLSVGGIPVLYLGDEVGTLNDHAYTERPGQGDDSRWVHRPHRDAGRHAQRHDRTTSAGRIYEGLRHLVKCRSTLPEMGGGRLIDFWTKSKSVLGLMRPGARGPILVLANYSETVQHVAADVLSAMPAVVTDALTGARVPLSNGVALKPYQLMWLDARARGTQAQP